MMDAYAHLDMSQPDPVADLYQRMHAGGVDRVLMVETWDGMNRGVLEQVRDHAVAFCWRGEDAFPSTAFAARVKTSVLNEPGVLLDQLERNHQSLIVHSDAPIASWAGVLSGIAESRPSLRIYVPHLGWPAFDGQPSRDWAACLATLAANRNVLLGVSAIAHFSHQPFPHDDVKALARIAMELFGESRVVAASDYPLFEKSRYGDYMRLVTEWIRDLWPDWSDDNALRT